MRKAIERFERIAGFIHLHRAKFAAGTVTVAFIWLMVHRAKEWNAFLREHDLYDKFYMTDLFE